MPKIKRRLPYVLLKHGLKNLEGKKSNRFLTFTGERIKGRFSADRQIPYIALRDIGDAVAGIFNDSDAGR